MGNLGMYQMITTAAKKVGGPRNLILLTLATGYAGGKGLETICKKTFKIISKSKGRNRLENKIYMIQKESVSNEGVRFNIGDQIRVCNIVQDVALIEKNGDKNNPYYIDIDLLYSMTGLNSDGIS